MKPWERIYRSEPSTCREWLEVLIRAVLPPVWHRDPLSLRSTAIFCQSDVRKLERRCRALWFDQKERRSIQRELLRRSLKMATYHLFHVRTSHEANSTHLFCEPPGRSKV